MRKDIAVIILYDDEKKVLLQHRDENSARLPGHWAFFGSSIEEGESPEKAVKREAKKELNYVLKSPALIMTLKFKGLHHQRTKYVFMEKYDSSKKLTLSEGDDMMWTSLEDIKTKNLRIVKHDKEVLEFIKDKY